MMEQKLIATISSVLRVPPTTLTLESGPGDLETWDSLAQINIVSEIEAEYGVTIPIEDVTEIHHIRDFLRYFGKRS